MVYARALRALECITHAGSSPASRTDFRLLGLRRQGGSRLRLEFHGRFGNSSSNSGFVVLNCLYSCPAAQDRGGEFFPVPISPRVGCTQWTSRSPAATRAPLTTLRSRLKPGSGRFPVLSIPASTRWWPLRRSVSMWTGPRPDCSD